jgi:4-aminobutyrate aminotransferase/(S)-3-amino-2-methylpropionate transaminase
MNQSQPRNQQAALTGPIPGPRSRELRVLEDTMLAPGAQGYALRAGVVIEQGRGNTVTDVDGNTYLDFIGGIAVNALGHSHPVFVEAVQAQVAKASAGTFTSPARVELLQRVSRMRPAPDITKVQLYSGGAEAVESALRLAKSHTGKHEFVSFWGGFHGKTMGALSLMGSTFKHKLGPMVPGSHLVPYPDCYRCPLGLTNPSCGLACADVARKQVKLAATDSVAAFIIEPMQGTAGNIIPPVDFLPAIADIAKENDALLIVDEMITGFGRTGKPWGMSHSGVKPDIVTVGKAFGGGFPLSGVLTTDAIAKATPWSNESGSSSSYGGNALAAAAGAAALRIIEEEQLVENSRIVGGQLLDELLPFVERYPFVGLVTGAGMMLRMELVTDKQSREPLPRSVTHRLFDALVQAGLMTMAYSPHFRLQPSLTLDHGTMMNGVQILRDAFDTMAKERWHHA